MVNGPQMELI